MSRRHYFKSIQSYQDLESSNLGKYVSDLERKVEEKSQSPSTINSFFLQEKPSYSKQQYQAELKLQVDQKIEKIKEEHQSKVKPGIDSTFHGYPNLPQTPREERRRREINQMNQFRNDLNLQLSLKQESLLNLKYKELESAKLSNSEDVQKFLEDKKKKIIKREMEKDALVNSWNQAKKANELKKILENAEFRGIPNRIEKDLENHHRSNEVEEFSDHYKKEKEIMPKAFSVPPELHGKNNKKDSLREKAKKIKQGIENKEKETYQYKIRELVKDAKIQRQLMKPKCKQGSPHEKILSYPSRQKLFASHKSFQLSTKLW
jgi:hypothetical protein